MILEDLIQMSDINLYHLPLELYSYIIILELKIFTKKLVTKLIINKLIKLILLL